MKITRIPWEVVRVAFLSIRGSFFKLDRPDPDAVADASLEQIQKVLGQNHFTKFWKLSYVYNGEDINMRRPEYIEDDEYNWYQYHVRGFETDGRVELNIHSELDPVTYPDEHIEKINYSDDPALSDVVDILRDEGIEVKIL